MSEVLLYRVLVICSRMDIFLLRVEGQSPPIRGFQRISFVCAVMIMDMVVPGRVQAVLYFVLRVIHLLVQRSNGAFRLPVSLDPSQNSVGFAH